ncbi:MAG TPA: hypothetical protein VGI80_05560, partial [Pyrinomonadaceae bacterium]
MYGRVPLVLGLCTLAFGFLAVRVAAQTQRIEKGWNGILPLASMKRDVENVFGKPYRIDDDGHYNYRTD